MPYRQCPCPVTFTLMRRVNAAGRPTRFLLLRKPEMRMLKTNEIIKCIIYIVLDFNVSGGAFHPAISSDPNVETIGLRFRGAEMVRTSSSTMMGLGLLRLLRAAGDESFLCPWRFWTVEFVLTTSTSRCWNIETALISLDRPRDARMNLKLGGGRICAFIQCQKMPEFCFIAYT